MSKTPLPDQSGPLARSLGEWAASLLDPYIAKLDVRPPEGEKQIHDPIGQSIMLNEWEVAVVDSPLMQRLRFVRQLGVGHLLFPTSGYSRFEHSLGALEAATLIFDAISKRQVGRLPYTDDEVTARRNVVRLAALLHDVGHCVFSHVSEKFYASMPAVKEARVQLAAFYKQRNITPSETLSILLVASEPFRRLIKASGIHRTTLDENEIVAKACCCIAGSQQMLWPDLFMADIVNGPIDCDKMDYLRRDAHMIGVPISLDVDRLVSKLRLAEIEKSNKTSAGFTLAIVPSGARALEELLVSRIFLYDKFYYHPKIMAAEAVIRRALAELVKAYPEFADPTLLLMYGDDEFLALTPKALIGRHGKPTDAGALKNACEWLTRARDRDLPKRAFAFARRFIGEAPDNYSRFVQRGKTKTVARGQDEYKRLHNSLRQQAVCDRYASRIQEAAKELGAITEVFLGFQDSDRAAGKMDLPVVLPGGKVDVHPDFLFNVSRWSSAYALNKHTSYAFAYEALPKVHLAAERVFAEEDLLFAPKSWVYSKLAREAIDEEREKIAADISGGTPSLHDSWIAYRLPPDFLESREAQDRIDALASKFSSFHHALHPKLGRDLIESWVWQFETADLQDSAISLLEYVHFVERAHVVTQVRAMLRRRPDLKKALWIPLSPGGSAKSADQIRVDLRKLDLQVVTWADAKLKKAKEIVFFDDLLNTGVQVECLLGSWFGNLKNCQHPSDADPSGPKSIELQRALRRANIHFAFYGSHPSGRSRLKACCGSLRLKLQSIESALDTASDAYSLSGLEGNTIASKEAFLRSLQSKGEALLRAKYGLTSKWTEKRMKEYALGYGGLRLTVVGRHSISTGLPVAMWMHSTDVVRPWLPIFPRSDSEVVPLLQLDDLPGSSIGDDD